MADDKGYLLSATAIEQIRKLIRDRPVMPTPDRSGTPVHNRSIALVEFVAAIGTHTGSIGSFTYAWTELAEDGGGNLVTKTGGMAGTTSIHPAKNDAEISPANLVGAVAGGTVVRMRVSFDAAGTPNFRFNCFQLPTLAQYQGWYGTTVGGAVTVVPDYVRAV